MERQAKNTVFAPRDMNFWAPSKPRPEFAPVTRMVRLLKEVVGLEGGFSFECRRERRKDIVVAVVCYC